MADDKYLNMALEDLARQRQETALALAARRRQALAAVPDLARLEDRIREEGIAAALAGRPSPQLAALAQEKRDALAAAGFAPDALEPRYACPICRDTGHAGDGLCTCVQNRIRALRRKDILADSPLSLSSFDTFSLAYYPDTPDTPGEQSPRERMADIYSFCVGYAAKLGSKSPSLLMVGRAGLGKTHLALAIAGQALDRGIDALYVSAQDAFVHVEQENFGGGDGSYMAALLDARFLVLDDLGTEFLSPFVVAELYRLIDSRLVRRRPTVYTTNLVTEAALAARYTEKIASRLLGNCVSLQFTGRDIRLLKRENR